MSAAEPAEPEPSRSWALALGWDGLHYEWGEKIPLVGQVVPLHDFEQVKLRGRIGLTVDLDGGHRVLDDGVSDGFRGSLRRGRIYTRGRFTWWTPTEYRVEFGFEEGDFFLNDFWLMWRSPRWLDERKLGLLDPPIDGLRVGYFDPPMTLDALTSSAARTFMEPAAPVSAFAPGFRLGGELRGVSETRQLSWALGLSSVGQSQNLGDASDAPLRLVGRLVWHPVVEPAAGGPISRWHLAFSLNSTFSGGEDARYRARPESLLAPFVVDTGDFASDGSAGAGLELAWVEGPFSAQGEAIFNFAEAEGEDVNFYGLYAQLSWTLTGETRPYDSLRATFGRVEPRRPVTRSLDGWGAWEIAARASWLDLSDGRIRGGAMWTATLGLNWIWNRQVRIQFNYLYTSVSQRSDESQGHIAQVRFQLRI